MPALFTRVQTRVRTKKISLICVALFLASCAFAAAQQSKTSEKAPAQTAKKPNVAVFALSGTPSPGKPWQRPKGVPKMRPLSPEEKLKVVQGVHGIPAVSAPAGTPFLTLYPGHLFEATGNLELGWPKWDRLGIAYYNWVVDPQTESAYDLLAKEEHVLLTFQADAGNVYLIDFLVVIEIPPTSTAHRDFELNVSGLPASDEQAVVGGNHLTAVLYVQTSGSYTARLGLKPKQGDSPHPSWGDWYFLATEVTKFVPAS